MEKDYQKGEESKRKKHANYYRVTHALIQKLEELFGAVVGEQTCTRITTSVGTESFPFLTLVQKELTIKDFQNTSSIGERNCSRIELPGVEVEAISMMCFLVEDTI